MPLSINLTSNTMRVAAGEPIFFSYQPQSGDRVAENLENRKFVFAVYDSARVDRGYFEAETVTGDDPEAVWRLDGSVSEGLLPFTNLKWEISERLDNGRDKIASGTLTIDVSAPRIMDYNDAPISRYITRVTRSNDPETVDRPIFQIAIRPYGIVAEAIPFNALLSPVDGRVLLSPIDGRILLRAEE
jgi:hypothetical protein